MNSSHGAYLGNYGGEKRAGNAANFIEMSRSPQKGSHRSPFSNPSTFRLVFASEQVSAAGNRDMQKERSQKYRSYSCNNQNQHVIKEVREAVQFATNTQTALDDQKMHLRKENWALANAGHKYLMEHLNTMSNKSLANTG